MKRMQRPRAGNVSRLMRNEEVAVRATERKYHAAELKAMGNRTRKQRPRKEKSKQAVPPMSDVEKKADKQKDKEEKKEEETAWANLSQASEARRKLTRTMLPLGHPMAHNIAALKANGGGGNGGGGSVGGTEIISAYTAAKEALKVMMDPFSDSALARWPDPFTLDPTMTTKDPDHGGMTIFNGTTAFDGATAAYIRGDQQFSWHEVTSIASSTGSSTSSTTPYLINWNCATPNWENLSQSMPNQAIARPVALGHRFTYSGVGEYHTIVARVIELPPWGQIETPDAAGADTPFPLQASAGPTYAQREFFRAREVTLAPGETLVVMSYPLDALSLIFEPLWYYVSGEDTLVPLSREDSNGRSWGGFLVVFWGLSSKDSVYHDACVHNEFVVAPVDVDVTDTDLNLAYPKAVVKPDSTSLDGVLDTVVDIVSSGANVFKTVLTKGKELFSTFVPMLFGGGAGQAMPVPPLSSSARMPHYSSMIRAGFKPPPGLLRDKPWLAAVKPAQPKTKDKSAVAKVAAAITSRKPPDEVKDLEDMPVVLTPNQARRPSLCPSLTVRKK